jgi:multidrug resistance protein MdtO
MFFTMFYALSALSNYAAASRFGYLVVITTPLWDRHIPGNQRVEDTRWAVYAISIASVITALLELVFAELSPGDDLIRGITERLSAVEELLALQATVPAVDEKTEKKITRLSTVETSNLRRLLERSTYSARYREQMGAVWRWWEGWWMKAGGYRREPEYPSVRRGHAERQTSATD